MSAVKGWEGAIKYSNRQVLEAVATGSGGAGQSYDLVKTASDELGDVTDDPTKVEVFLDGVLQATTGIYTLDGDGGTAGVGQLTFSGSHDGEVIEASYYAYEAIGYVQSIGYTQNNNVEPIYEINDGTRLPVEVKEGNINISLSMERASIDLGLIATVVHQISAARGWLAENEFDIELYPAGTTGGNPEMIVRGKFNNISMSMSQDAIAMDSIEFTGRDVTVTTA